MQAGLALLLTDMGPWRRRVEVICAVFQKHFIQGRLMQLALFFSWKVQSLWKLCLSCDNIFRTFLFQNGRYKHEKTAILRIGLIKLFVIVIVIVPS